MELSSTSATLTYNPGWSVVRTSRTARISRDEPRAARLSSSLAVVGSGRELRTHGARPLIVRHVVHKCRSAVPEVMRAPPSAAAWEAAAAESAARKSAAREAATEAAAKRVLLLLLLLVHRVGIVDVLSRVVPAGWDGMGRDET
jgi:hypothetical protein